MKKYSEILLTERNCASLRLQEVQAALITCDPSRVPLTSQLLTGKFCKLSIRGHPCNKQSKKSLATQDAGRACD